MADDTATTSAFERAHAWHPYAPMPAPLPPLLVRRAFGCRLDLADGTQLIDGMASWWCSIHGYNHPRLNAAAARQLQAMAHVMFGGLTHEPAIRLIERLLDIVPKPLSAVFLCDSGSVAVEVALKMALQYWQSAGETGKNRFLTVRGGYHGDTFGAMSVCDPVTGMHRWFEGFLPRQLFADRPRVRFDGVWDARDVEGLAALLREHRDAIAAVIVEPIVQGAGGMWFYHPQYLRELRALCSAQDVLLILDEIATGFGRTGALFACEHAGIAPDILCIGKALTGGYMTLAATLTTDAIAAVISSGGRALMHGPTFMANPLACAVALESIDVLLESPWRERVKTIQTELLQGLAGCADHPGVADVRVLGAIGVVEMVNAVDVPAATREFVKRGVWLRPFGKLIYTMPPFVITPAELAQVTRAISEVAAAQTA